MLGAPMSSPPEPDRLPDLVIVPGVALDREAAEEALAEFLARVAVRRWNSQADRARVSGDPAEGRLPPPGLTTSA